ncbi:hypothetical protein HC733_02890 [Pseudoalteromonas sp. S16_S37]|nr:hypothetical protein [Pseudoalteromonas sp. S16_S37]
MSHCLKPTITARDIDLIRHLNGLKLRYYVLVHIKSTNSNQFDLALFLDDFEAIQGIPKALVQQRAMPLSMAVHMINSILL